jgi:hypothetical protein
MQVINLVAWAGPEFSCAVGDLIDLPDDVAATRIDLELCAPVPADPGVAVAETKKSQQSAKGK